LDDASLERGCVSVRFFQEKEEGLRLCREGKVGLKVEKPEVGHT
jgi:hypothetical protein